MTPADNPLVPKLPENGRVLAAELTPPLMMGPEVISTDSCIGTLPLLENSCAADPSVFGTVPQNCRLDQSGFIMRPDLWDGFYVDAHGAIKKPWNGD